MEQLDEKVPDIILIKLKKAGINRFEDFLIKPKTEICSITKLTNKDVELITVIITETVLKNTFIKVSSLPICKYLRTGCNDIDKLIKGIPVNGGITEIFGESGSGKTQLALQLALQVQKLEICGGLNGGCIYMCTEDIFPSKRLYEMQKYLEEIQNEDNQIYNYGDNIFIEHISDIDQLKRSLDIKVPVLLRQKNIKLIIIDSIAGAFRYDNETKNYISRSEDLSYISEKLCDLSNEYKLAVICTNQVTSDPIEGLKPCLGLAWSNLIQNRFQIIRSGRIIKDYQTFPAREIKVIFSPYLPVSNTNFIISKKGIENLY